MFRAFAGKYPLWLAWQVTYRCNFRCGFCGYWKSPEGAEPEQTVEQFEYGAKQLGRVGSMLISLAGGEPLLREDLVDIIKVVARYHLPFVTTNGYLLTREMAADIYEAGIWGVSVSVDYADAAKHDRRRGMKGAFARAVEALDHLARGRRHRWQRLNLMAVLMHDNFEDMEELARLAHQYNAYLMIQPYCKLKTGDEQFMCRDDDISEKLLELRRRLPNFLSNPYFLGQFGEALNGGVPNCLAGRSFFNIDSQGDVAICVEKRGQPVGNLYKDDIIALFQRMRPVHKTNRCRQCWYNCRGEVESIYRPYGLFRSLPTYVFDRGRAPQKAPIW